MSVVQTWRIGAKAPAVSRVFPPNPIYVDTLHGKITGKGSQSDPVNTLSIALDLCSGLPDYEIKIRAPENNPLRQEVIFNTSRNVYISGTDHEPWHIYGSEIHNSNWTQVSNNIYCKAMGYTSVSQVVVTSLNEKIVDRYFHVKLLQNIQTPTTPAPGEYGYVSGIIYVNMPDDSTPNTHTIEVSCRNFGVGTIGLGMLTVSDCVSRYAMIDGIHNGQSTQPENTGYLTVNNSLTEFCVNAGVGTSGRNELTICNNVKSFRIGNDGFGAHAPTGGEGLIVLNGCTGSYNGDVPGESAQGASNHERTKMIINGGTFNHNVSGGMVVIDYARCDIHGDTEYGPVVMDGNMRLGNTVGTIASQASCAWLNYSSGMITGDVTVKNGGGVGLRRGPAAEVIGIELIKSINNSLPDRF